MWRRPAGVRVCLCVCVCLCDFRRVSQPEVINEKPRCRATSVQVRVHDSKSLRCMSRIPPTPTCPHNSTSSAGQHTHSPFPLPLTLNIGGKHTIFTQAAQEGALRMIESGRRAAELKKVDGLQRAETAGSAAEVQAGGGDAGHA